MARYLIPLALTLLFLSACSGVSTVDAMIPTQTASSLQVNPTAALTPFPTFTPTITTNPDTSEPEGFPYAAQLNDILPKDNLILARHYYGDPDESVAGDEVCYDVAIYGDDTYFAVSCASGFTYPVPTGKLDENQTRFLHLWTKTFKGFDEPSIHGLLKFNGRGSRTPEYSDRVSMHAMLSDIEWNANAYVHRGGTPMVVFHARSVLMDRLNIWLDASSIRHFEYVVYPDSCLGVPKPDEICEQVPTQGFRIFLVAQGMMYEFHTDAFGYDIRSFGEPQIAPTQGAGG